MGSSAQQVEEQIFLLQQKQRRDQVDTPGIGERQLITCLYNFDGVLSRLPCRCWVRIMRFVSCAGGSLAPGMGGAVQQVQETTLLLEQSDRCHTLE